MKELSIDTSMLTEADSIIDEYGSMFIAFRILKPAGSYITGSYIDVISLYVEDGKYHLAGSSCVPNQTHVTSFACAWKRCLNFINSNNLEARVSA